MDKYENTEFLTEDEKNESIQLIVSMGIPKPQTFSHSVAELWHAIGLRGIFFGVEDAIFLSMLLSALVWGGSFVISAENQSLLCVILFLLSPFLYAILHLLTVWKEIMIGMYESKVVCRFNFRQITAVRMMIFGGGSVILCVFASVVLWVLTEATIPMIRLMSISFSALFLFALLQLLCEWKWRAPMSYCITPAVWIGMSTILICFGKSAERLMMNIPTLVFGLCAIGAAAAYMKLLKHYCYDNKEGALIHVVA